MRRLKIGGLLAALQLMTMTVFRPSVLAQTAGRVQSASVSPNAVGAPAPTATPIGGLTGRPIRGAAVGGGGAVVPLRVPDAALLRGSAVRTRALSGNENGADVERDATLSPRSRWIPTADAPTWRRDPRVRPVDGWRDLIVSDVVCSTSGGCQRREYAVRAPWVARCGCYAFTDGWNRLWRVE